jgi:hypothetical protein
MALTAFTIALHKIDESLLFQDSKGNWWLSCVCTLEQDDRGRNIVAQSVPKERYAAGEKGPAIGTWREIGKDKPAAPQQAKGFDLSKYKHPAAPPGPGQSAGNDPQPKPDGLDDLGF